MKKVSLFYASFSLIACGATSIDPSYIPSESRFDFNQESFEKHVLDTRSWLSENRHFKMAAHEQEVSLNAPREWKPERSNGGLVLLVHGLGDSPFSFIDIAKHLTHKGYHVRTVLLAGHGSRAGDLLGVSFELWRSQVQHHVKQALQDFDQVWLGGFSTGANLVTEQAYKNPKVEGLLLFSPAFQPGSPLVKWAGIANLFMDWADKDPEINKVRYDSLPLDAAESYYNSSLAVMDYLDSSNYSKPVFMALSQNDSVIDVDYAKSVFLKRFENSNNHLFYQSRGCNESDISCFDMNLPELRISSGSHMGLLFNKDNFYYGQGGEMTICNNGQAAEIEKACNQGESMWYGSWGYQLDGVGHARLTWNPYFQELTALLDQVMINNNAVVD
ncbi:alpha/beta fold hydrolase [uncultured Pseudoteredinibacter sp.]|uniref:alpha/beta hydrolase n=1 Tax=uncultured Pseudoteredinibacter sp. TaxID=1641701 RepID=UPI002609D3B9|nr:alpha/beta fold hydrolase [uncultured Pseudoteredinibacter sp.]